ncbi:hypothetical protein Y1Q_0009645 [Alligator mississippiensis]|uniref:Uncharacterized protein n=1 Tax=Alligator mississippiensis TaxID=8496 RepID=A0A151NV76_ALLMI|nr:hypothetical protein Y1Q_0009645 [Alligator mississippiensis]
MIYGGRDAAAKRRILPNVFTRELVRASGLPVLAERRLPDEVQDERGEQEEEKGELGLNGSLAAVEQLPGSSLVKKAKPKRGL